MRVIDYILITVIAILVFLALRHMRLYKNGCRGCQSCQYHDECGKHFGDQKTKHPSAKAGGC
jgi:hypothetical protein